MECTRSRREFLQAALGAAATVSLANEFLAQTSTVAGSGIPTRPLGRTGVRVSILGLGGGHVGLVRDEQEAFRIMHAAIDEGITFFDNGWDYTWVLDKSPAEELMGRGLAQGGRRQKVFLMTKCCARDYEGAKKNLEDSLRRLRTEYLDLWQFHALSWDNDPDWIFDKGAIRAAVEAKEAGKVRFIGFTGHKDPRIHVKMLKKTFPWDTAQMPNNVMDFHFRSFRNEVMPACLQKGVGIIGMKSLGHGRIPKRAGIPAPRCIHYALSQPVSTQLVGCKSMADLHQAIRVARDFKPMSMDDLMNLLDTTREAAGDGRYELYKTTLYYDGHRDMRLFTDDPYNER